MPQAFGTFEQNLTLINTVCQACNDFFACELEPWLSRDSIEGFDRYRYGDKEPNSFKSMGARSTSKMQIMEGPYAGAWGYAAPGKKRLAAHPFPQVGFAKAKDSDYEWFLLDDLPTLEELKAKGYAGEVLLRTCETDQETAQRRLKDKGIEYELRSSFDASVQGIWLDEVFRPERQHKRALAKVAVNYVAKQFGAELVRGASFDAIRGFVMHGSEPEFAYYALDEEPLIKGDKQDDLRLKIHAIVVQPLPDGIRAIVTLYNRFRHGFRLTTRPPQGFESRGHLFDIGNRVILEMAPSTG